MIREIQQPPFQTVGVMDLETFYPEKDRTALAMDLNNLLASPSFAGWMTGQPLDVQQLFYSPPDKEGRVKPRHSIVSIAHLDDAQRMFFVTILLNEIVAWMRTQPGTGSLRALVYMDEVFGYFPPSAKPPSKEPMLTLLKQARAFGLGVVLATQNPVDLDYKGLSNAGTWFLGRLQTERDKMRVMEGLEGASAAAGSTFDKQQMERTLAGVGSRVFLMNNVHEDQPRVFHTRWAMSYLAGPLSRNQIRGLMDPVRDKFAPPKDEEPAKIPVPVATNQEAPEPGAQAPGATDEPTPPPAPATPDPTPETKKVRELRQRVKEKENALFLSLTLVLLRAAWEPIWRGFDLLMASLRKQATKRRTSSMISAVGRAGGKLGEPVENWREWAEAHGRLQAALPEDARRPRPAIPARCWLAIGLLGLQLLGLLAVLVVLLIYGVELLRGFAETPPSP